MTWRPAVGVVRAGGLARPLPAAELVRVLVDEAREVIDHLRRVAGGFP